MIMIIKEKDTNGGESRGRNIIQKKTRTNKQRCPLYLFPVDP